MMDNQRITDPDDEDSIWADSVLMDRVAQGLRDAYVRPLDRSTERKHLAAIADALAPSKPVPFERPAERPALPQASGGLASPFAARTSATRRAGNAPAPLLETAVAPSRKARRPELSIGYLATRAAAIAVVVAAGAAGLAMAGALPKPVQTAFSQAGDVVGLTIPAPLSSPEQPVVVPVAPQPVPANPAPAPGAEPRPVPVNPAPAPQPVAEPPAPQPAPAPAQAPAQDWMATLIQRALETASNPAYNQLQSPYAKPGFNGSDTWNAYRDRYGFSPPGSNPGANSPSR